MGRSFAPILPAHHSENKKHAQKLKARTLTNLYNERPTWLDLAYKSSTPPSLPPTAGSRT
jgi:hypothetical protein